MTSTRLTLYTGNDTLFVQETIGRITDYSLLDEQNFLHLTERDGKSICVAVGSIVQMDDMR